MGLAGFLLKLIHGGDWCYLADTLCEDVRTPGCSTKSSCEWHTKNYRGSARKVKI